MDKEIIITKRFRKNVMSVHSYLLKEFSEKTALEFLSRLEKRIEFIALHHLTGKPSLKKDNVRSLLFTPHNQIFYRQKENKIEILCLFDMRKDPSKKPY